MTTKAGQALIDNYRDVEDDVAAIEREVREVIGSRVERVRRYLDQIEQMAQEAIDRSEGVNAPWLVSNVREVRKLLDDEAVD